MREVEYMHACMYICENQPENKSHYTLKWRRVEGRSRYTARRQMCRCDICRRDLYLVYIYYCGKAGQGKGTGAEGAGERHLREKAMSIVVWEG